MLTKIDSVIGTLQNSVEISQTNYWIYIAAALLAAILGSFLLRFPVRLILSQSLGRIFPSSIDLLIKKLLGPIQIFIFLLLFFMAYLVIDGHKDVKEVLNFGFNTALFIAVAYFCYRIVDLLFDRAMLEHQTRRSKIVLVLPLARRISKLALIITALLFYLAQFGVDVSALLVGLGVGSLAIALAAQKILENLFGGAVLSLDQPFRVGDYCKCGDTLGIIEEIGIRSTRIRTLDRTQVCIPNAVLSQMTIENFHEREKIRIYKIIRLALETRPEQIKDFIDKMNNYILTNEELHSESFRIRLLNITEFGYDLEVYIFAKTVEWSEFTAVRETVLFKILQFFTELDIKLAIPERKIRS